MKEIQLTKGKFAIVDEEDYQRLMEHNWHYSGEYAARSITRRKNGKRNSSNVWMHKVVINSPEGMQVDHINRNKLDNRKSNLRVCTSHQNSINIGIRKDNNSGYKGVFFDSRSGKWVARIRHREKSIWIGTFDCVHQAGRAYNDVAFKFHGEFAYLNEIKSPSANGLQ